MSGETLTRAGLSEALHREVGLTRHECARLVDRTLEMMIAALVDGEIVKLSGFGVFHVRSKNEREGRNPMTGAPARITPRRVVGFRASQLLKARVDEALSD